MIITNLIEEKKLSQDFYRSEFMKEIANGLNSMPKIISSKYFYDDIGSQLFVEITKLDEYYPTKAEEEILLSLKDILPDLVGRDEVDIIELGVGDGHKTKILIDSFIKSKIKINFYPIDISLEAMNLLEENLPKSNNLKVHGIVSEYLEGLRFARMNSCNRQIVLFLGGNIGNFDRHESLKILNSIRLTLNEDDFLLIGFDLKKNIDKMQNAYNDKRGITALFNLNLLERINSELHGNFIKENFRHQAFYNPTIGAMESYLISLIDQDVEINDLNQTFHFEEFEAIHMEYSFKFLEKDIIEICEQTGFTHISSFKDTRQYFIDSLWQV